MTAEEIEKELMSDPAYLEFIESLEDKRKPF